jgi:hypothetical protein
MERLILAFLAILVIAFIFSVLYSETFNNYQGGGQSIQVDSDVLPGAPQMPLPGAPSDTYEMPGTDITNEGNLESFYAPDLTTYSPQAGDYSPSSDITPMLLEHQKNAKRTPAVKQGQDFASYAPAMNPAEWIRKDSIPCYACTVP